MINLGRALLLSIALVLFANSLFAQVQYDVVRPETIQKRLDAYKGNDTVRQTALVTLFNQAGCSAENLSEQPVPSRKQPNVICTLPGSSPEIIVVGAHFDHVPEGDGIIDNWSGASLLPSLFQSLVRSARKHTFIFVAFTGEEEGLVGSSYYVKQLPKDQIFRIEAMINLDSLGLGPTKVWISQSDPRLVNVLGLLAQSMKIPIAGMNVDGFGQSDEESFISKKVCTVTVHSVTPETGHVLHHSADNPSAVRFNDYYDTYRLLAAYLAVLDTQLVADEHSCKAKAISP
jgi:Zn-dependent M28 family amino/carboxypeptidase